jgi:hypothetical protein
LQLQTGLEDADIQTPRCPSYGTEPEQVFD